MTVNDPTAIEAALIHLLADRLLDIGPDFDASSSLSDAGLDSMGIMQLLIQIEDELGVSLPDEDLCKENFATVRALAGTLLRRLGEDPATT